MNLETCTKYLAFVQAECNRHLGGGRILDDQINQMLVEFNRFKDKCADSDLPEEVKQKIAALTFNYTAKAVRQNYWIIFVIFLTLGSWSYLQYYRNQQKRKRALMDLKNNVSSLAVFIKMNY